MKSQWPTVDNYVLTRSEYFGVRVQGLRDSPDNESYCSAVIFKTLYKLYAVIRCSSQCVIVQQSNNQLINRINLSWLPLHYNYQWLLFYFSVHLWNVRKQVIPAIWKKVMWQNSVWSAVSIMKCGWYRLSVITTYLYCFKCKNAVHALRIIAG